MTASYDRRIYAPAVTNAQLQEPKLSPHEAAKILSVSHMTVRRLCDAGKLRHYVITPAGNRLIRIPLSAVREYLAAAQTGGAA